MIAYQIRQSFKPGEVTPDEANTIGYELAMRFTKGKHAFVVSTHTDRPHIHNHIIFCATALECDRKFKNFNLSAFALARLSDLICLEHKLSVIIRQPYDERVKRTEYPKQKSQRDEICEAIDAAMKRKPKSFSELIMLLQEAGYEFKDGKQPALRGKGHVRFARFRSLGEGYSKDELSAAIAGETEHKSKFAGKNKITRKSSQSHAKSGLSLMIDVREKMLEGKGAGYERWAKVFNVKQLAKALQFMEQNGLKSYDDLAEKAHDMATHRDDLLASVKADETRLQEINILRTHLVNYAKSKDVFAEYKASGYSRDYFEAHRDVLTLRRAAKRAFDEYKVKYGENKKLPRIKELNAEYADVLERKKKTYADYRKARNDAKDWVVAQKIARSILAEEQQIKAQLEKEQAYTQQEVR